MTGPSINYDRLKQRRTEGSRGGAGWKPKEGENRVRVLPPHSKYLADWSAMEDIAIGIEVHFFRLAGGAQIEVTRCPKDLKQPCPACDAYWANKDSADPGFKELANQAKSSRIYLMNILDISNMQGGVQHWGSNYTCWDKILEIVANPSYGNVLDPANGINFFVNLTPRNRSRTGFPQYTVDVERQGGPAGPALRTTVMEMLNQVPNWQAKLDELSNQVPPMKTTAEIQALLDVLRVPPAAGQARTPAVARPPAGAVASITSVPVPVAAPVPIAAPAPVPAPAPIAAPVPVVSVPVPVPTQATVVAAPTVVTGFAGPVVQTQIVAHYDPGPQYQEKTPIERRPEGSPRCFGDYNPGVHQCHPCPVKGSCQMKMLGVA